MPTLAADAPLPCSPRLRRRSRFGQHEPMVRALPDVEITELLQADTVARLATIAPDGYPHVTPIWFLWTADAFHFTSYRDRPHLDRIHADPRVGLVIDIEDELRADGERPNRQVRVTGDAVLAPDTDYRWTDRIRAKYLGAAGDRPQNRERVLITVRPREIVAIASV